MHEKSLLQPHCIAINHFLLTRCVVYFSVAARCILTIYDRFETGRNLRPMDGRGSRSLRRGNGINQETQDGQFSKIKTYYEDLKCSLASKAKAFWLRLRIHFQSFSMTVSSSSGISKDVLNFEMKRSLVSFIFIITFRLTSNQIRMNVMNVA